MKRKLIKLLFATIIISEFYVRIVSAAPLAFSTERIGGQDRVDTAIAVSNKGWTTANNVILCELDDYPDALSATPLAKMLDAPILLTNGNALEPRVITELKRLSPSQITILGGEGVATKNLTDSLDNLGLKWERIGGKDRYATSALIAQRIPNDSQTVIFVNGDNFPDALVSSSYAAIKQIPILLTQAQGIPDTIRQVYLQRSPSHVLVVGGTGVVPDNTLTNIPVESRLGGANRYDTAAKIYRYAQASYASQSAYMVSGEAFADAMVGVVLAAKGSSPLFLTQTVTVPASSYSVIRSAANQTKPLQKIVILGGTGVVTSSVANILEGNAPAGYVYTGQTIVLDPGHGGSDPGACANNLEEADINLAVALKLRDRLLSEGYIVKMTRDTDTFVSLDARSDFSNVSGADIFISLHSNSGPPDVTGVLGTYFHAGYGYGDIGDWPYESQADANWQLNQALADSIANSLSISTLQTVKPSESHAFSVLRLNKVPATLIEMGFMSNAATAALMQTTDWQYKAVSGITLGVNNYFLTH